MFSLLRFVLPIALWLFLMRDFLLGIIPVNMDTHTIYGVVKYYFNNLANGVVPLWEPFVDLGRPFYALVICNLFNPITQLVLVLKFLGVNYYAGFLTYITAYFLVGCIGFYWLAKEVLKDKHWAWVAFVAFLFSSLGPSLFTQLTFIEILVPAIWLFFFILRFAHQQTQGYFLGICYSLMTVLTSYLPFYVVTVLGIFVLLCSALYPRRVWQYLKNSFRFKLKHWRLTLLGAIGVLMAAAPLIAYKMIDASGAVVAPGRHCQYTSAQECYERTMNDFGGMSYTEITRSGALGERLDLGYLFAHLDKITYGSDSLFFIPILIMVMIAAGLFVKTQRSTLVMVGMAVIIALIALGDGAPLYRWLYEHISFFRYFRNLFFFGALLIPLVILLGVRSLQDLLAIPVDSWGKRKVMIVGVICLHGIFALFLSQYRGILVTAWVTVFLSAIACGCYFAGLWQKKGQVWAAIFGLLMMLQPAQVIAAYGANALEFRCSLPSQHVTPVFNWVRPLKGQASKSRIYQFVPYEDFWYAMNMTDATAKVDYPQSAARWTFEATQKLGSNVVADYARYKIYVAPDLNLPPTPILSQSDALRVVSFDVNQLSLATNFNKQSWLIYNDSYTDHWKAYIDGKKVPLVRANVAFKAVFVPQGQAQVSFRYEPPGGQWVYLLASAVLLLFLLWLLVVIARPALL